MHRNHERQVIKKFRRIAAGLQPQPELVVIQLSDKGLMSVDDYVRREGVPLWERAPHMDVRNDN